MDRLAGFLLLGLSFHFAQSGFWSIWQAAQKGESPLNFGSGYISPLGFFGILFSTGFFLVIFGAQFFSFIPSRGQNLPWKVMIIPLTWLVLAVAPLEILEYKVATLGYRCNTPFYAISGLEERSCHK